MNKIIQELSLKSNNNFVMKFLHEDDERLPLTQMRDS